MFKNLLTLALMFALVAPFALTALPQAQAAPATSSLTLTEEQKKPKPSPTPTPRRPGGPTRSDEE